MYPRCCLRMRLFRILEKCCDTEYLALLSRNFMVQLPQLLRSRLSLSLSVMSRLANDVETVTLPGDTCYLMCNSFTRAMSPFRRDAIAHLAPNLCTFSVMHRSPASPLPHLFFPIQSGGVSAYWHTSRDVRLLSATTRATVCNSVELCGNRLALFCSVSMHHHLHANWTPIEIESLTQGILCSVHSAFGRQKKHNINSHAGRITSNTVRRSIIKLRCGPHSWSNEQKRLCFYCAKVMAAAN